MSSLPPPLPPAGRLPRRGAWEVQRGVLFSLVLREMKTRVGGQWIGAVWTLIEPLAHVLVMLTIFSAIRSSGMPGMEYPVFLATGLVPYFLFQHLSTRLMDGIDANRGLYAYRQVKPFDTLMSRAVVEVLMNMLVYGVTLGLLAWLGFHVWPAGPLELMGVQMVLALLGTSFGVFAAVVSHERPRLRSFIRISMMPLYFASGILFPIHYAPPDMLEWLAWNPLLHLIELSRHAFMADYWTLQQVNIVYPLLFSLTLSALAMLVYRADRLRLVRT
jgi:capsular polysaccharide transport system permease protein